MINADDTIRKDPFFYTMPIVEGSLQKKLESSLDSVFAAQTQQMHKTFSSIENELQAQVGKTGEAVEKQLGMIDQSMQQEINRVMNEMGKALAQIANQFVNDYSELVSRMDSITKQQISA